MPTGYTADVQSGKITTLRDFALECARAFGAAIPMRDEPFDTPIPERFEPSLDYYNEQKTIAQETLTELPKLSTEECTRRAIADHADALDYHREYLADNEQSRLRYDAMLTKLRAWEVPEELTKLKEFMEDQLCESIRHDCSVGYSPPEPQLKSGEEWRNETLLSAAQDLAYALKHIQDEIKRTEERNLWLKTLRESLKGQE